MQKRLATTPISVFASYAGGCKLRFICGNRRKGWQPPAPQSKKEMIQKIKSFGDFNNWRGFIGLYLTTKEVRQLKKYGITSDTTIRDAYEILCNK